MLALRGRPDAPVETAAMNGVLPGTPRLRLLAEAHPAEISAVPLHPALQRLVSLAPRHHRMICCFIVQAVGCLTPSWRPSSTDEMPFFTVTIRWMAENHTVNGSLVALIDRMARWKAVPGMAAARTDETATPAQPGQRGEALLFDSEHLAKLRVVQPAHPRGNLQPYLRNLHTLKYPRNTANLRWTLKDKQET